jgi:diguanylate cyclase (GGDEF)-like protein
MRLPIIKKQISLKTTVMSLFFLVTLALSAVFITQLFMYSEKLSYETINVKIEGLVQASKESLLNQEVVNENIIKLLHIANDNQLKFYSSILEHNPRLYAVYKGFSDGGFYEIINLDIHASLRKIYKAKEEDRWLLIDIKAKNPALKKVVLYNENLEKTRERFEANEYDPRQRPWYKLAIQKSQAIKTEPYAFSNIPTKGITYAQKLQSNNDVIAIDVLLYDVKALFEKIIHDDYTHAYLFDKNKVVISSMNDNYVLKDFFAQGYAIKDFLTPQILTLNGIEYIVQFQSLQTKNGEHLALFSQYDEVIKPHQEQMYKLLAVFIVSVLLIIPCVVYLSHMIVKPIYKLIVQSQKVQRREFDKIKIIDTPVLEVAQLSSSMFDMSQAIYSYQTSLEKKVKQRTYELSLKNEELYKLSITDKLTDLNNRVHLDKVLHQEFERSKQHNMIFCVILMDIDFFKKVNDMYGHQIGDDVLVETAQILKKIVRGSDTVGRWGGEEFLVVCPQTNVTGALKVAQKINQAIKEHQFSTYENQVTMSLGVSCFTQECQKVEEIIAQADEALYKAKEQGRNCVVTYKKV